MALVLFWSFNFVGKVHHPFKVVEIVDFLFYLLVKVEIIFLFYFNVLLGRIKETAKNSWKIPTNFLT